MRMVDDPVSGLTIPEKLYEEKHSLKKSIEQVVERAINDIGSTDENYFLTIHAMFDIERPNVFKISEPLATVELPPFRSNTLVYWVSPRRGFHELLWIVPAVAKGEKLRPEFNQDGVAFLQAAGAMPKPS